MAGAHFVNPQGEEPVEGQRRAPPALQVVPTTSSLPNYFSPQILAAHASAAETEACSVHWGLPGPQVKLQQMHRVKREETAPTVHCRPAAPIPKQG